MPSDSALRSRGGVEKVRTIRLPDGRYMHVYVVRQAGPRGGHSLGGEVKRRKTHRVPDRRPNYRTRADERREEE